MTEKMNPYGELGDDGQYPQNAQYPESTEYPQNGHYPQYSQFAAGWGNPSAGMERDAGFFSALFDFSFRKYATPAIVKIVYILLTVVMTVGLLVWGFTGVISAFAVDEGLGALVLLVGIPVVLIVFILQLALFRMLLEAGLALVRAAQSLQNLEQR